MHTTVRCTTLVVILVVLLLLVVQAAEGLRGDETKRDVTRRGTSRVIRDRQIDIRLDRHIHQHTANK